VGFVLGDAALFQAFITIGTRLTMLVFAINPVIGSLLARAFLDERLTEWQIVGMIVTIAGVAWVVSEQNTQTKGDLSPKEYAVGILLAFLGAAGQAGGMVTAKMGLYDNFPAMSGQIIRVLAATVIIWIVALLSRKAKDTVETLKAQPLAVRQILLASFIGPFIGVFFSLVAIQYASVGVASTLTSLPPVFLIPISYFFFKEKITWRAIVGTVVALSGVAVLFLV
jgi:drug/metabolite transporter (DMT)-like permease